MTSDTMDDEEGGADAPRQGRNTNRASMQDAGTRETAGIKCRMQEREKQPASNAVEKKKEIVTTCSSD